MLFTVHWADAGPTSMTFTIYMDALDWVYMLGDLGFAPYMCIEEMN